MTFWDRREKKWVALLCLMPFLWMIYSLLSGRYFPDPAEPLMTISGIWACVFLILVLMLTPINKYSSFRGPNRYRRFLGLTAFWYALLHLLIYLVFHAGLSWSWIRLDLLERPYIYIGVLAILILFILAITSTKKMMRKLGKRWKVIHRFIYLAALAVIAHLWWQVKSDISIALWVSLFLVPLLVLRLRAFIPRKQLN